jgi:hypothetical protein
MKGSKGRRKELPWYREFDELDVLDPPLTKRKETAIRKRSVIPWFFRPLLDEKEGRLPNKQGNQPFTLKETKEKVEP